MVHVPDPSVLSFSCSMDGFGLLQILHKYGLREWKSYLPSKEMEGLRSRVQLGINRQKGRDDYAK